MKKLTEEEQNYLLSLAKDNGLTRRENEIALYISLGASTKQIAEQLFIAERTVLIHLQNIYPKINARNSQSGLTAWWISTIFELKVLDQDLVDKLSEFK